MTYDLIQIKQTLDSSSGRALKEYLYDRLLELRDIDNIREFATASVQSQEIKAQMRAYNKLKEILDKIMTIDSTTGEKDPRDSFIVE